MIYLAIILGILLIIAIIYNEILLIRATKDGINKIVKDILKNYNWRNKK